MTEGSFTQSDFYKRAHIHWKMPRTTTVWPTATEQLYWRRWG